jgi:hypothetical protein
VHDVRAAILLGHVEYIAEFRASFDEIESKCGNIVY